MNQVYLKNSSNPYFLQRQVLSTPLSNFYFHISINFLILLFLNFQLQASSMEFSQWKMRIQLYFPICHHAYTHFSFPHRFPIELTCNFRQNNIMMEMLYYMISLTSIHNILFSLCEQLAFFVTIVHLFHCLCTYDESNHKMSSICINFSQHNQICQFHPLRKSLQVSSNSL